MTGFVYAIECGDAVKIGWTRNPARRVMQVSAGSMAPFRLLSFVPATRKQENDLHKLLEPFRLRGEWFRKDGPVLHFLSLLPPRSKDDLIRALPSPNGDVKNECAERLADGDIADILSSFGTLTEVARILGCNLSTVTEMKRRGSIPSRHWERLLHSEKGQALGLTAETLLRAHRKESAA